MAPGVVSAIVCAADGAAHVTPHPRWTTRSWAVVAAGNTAWGACVDFGEAGLAVPAAYRATRRHCCDRDVTKWMTLCMQCSTAIAGGCYVCTFYEQRRTNQGLSWEALHNVTPEKHILRPFTTKFRR